MNPIVAIVAQGSMGAGLARVLTSHGVTVLTTLAGRSAASVERAAAAGMRAVEPAELAGSDILLSVLPPGEALGFAARMAPILRASDRETLFADCNAVSPETVRSIECSLADTGTLFADVGIIGLPPKPGGSGPHLYAAGPGATRLSALQAHGLDVRVLPGSVGAASALKMSFAGISKGLLAVASTMILGATRSGVAAALHSELSESNPQLLESLARHVPDMLPKAYRWVEEMHQIAQFLTADPGGQALYAGAAKLFERLAADNAGERTEAAVLSGFFKSRNGEPP